MDKNGRETGTLYIVATPIGNLGDLTMRACDVLKKVDFIAAEDTRVTSKLLNYLEIKKPIVSYYEHNLKQKGEYILSRIIAGESCALCSDAGTPAISDPGEIIVRDAHEAGIKVEPIPGACAAIAALCTSGQITGTFVFEGFLPTNKRQKKQRIEELKHQAKTSIIYEAPHKLLTTLTDLCEAMDTQRSVTVCREITKLHEEIFITTLGDAKKLYTEKAPRGEFVLVLSGATKGDSESAVDGDENAPKYTLQEASAIAAKYMEDGDSASMAAKKAAKMTGLAKSEIYKQCGTQKISEENGE